MVVRPTMDEEIFMRDRFEKGKDWYTVEGAFYFRKGDWHFRKPFCRCSRFMIFGATSLI